MRIAKNLYNQVLEINHAHLYTENNPGILKKMLVEHQKAKTYFEKATQTNPSYVSAHNDLGFIKEIRRKSKGKRLLRESN